MPGYFGGKQAKGLAPWNNDKEEADRAKELIKKFETLQQNVLWTAPNVWKNIWNLFIYLHESDEQEEGIGGPSDLFIQEAGQKGEHPILGSTIKKKNIFSCISVQCLQ